MSRLFISVERLEAWSAEGRANLEGDRMTLADLPGRAFGMQPGIHFVKVTGDDHDPNDLVGRVKTKHDLEEMGGELFGNSVIFKDTAYDIVEGFIGSPL